MVDTVQKPPDRVLLIAHFSAWSCPRVMRIAVSGPHGLASSNGAKPLAPPCAPNASGVINNSRPGCAPERLHLVRSRKRSQTLVGEWKYVLVCRMTPLSRPGCPLGPYTSRFRNFIFGSCSIFIPGRPAGPPVARSATNPWAPRLENGKGSRPARAEPTAARVWPKLVSCKSLSECCEARPGRRPDRAPGQGWWWVGARG